MAALADTNYSPISFQISGNGFREARLEMLLVGESKALAQLRLHSRLILKNKVCFEMDAEDFR